MKTAQQNFLKSLEVKSKLTHGGRDSRGKRKVRRPLDTNKPLHLVMRSSRATGKLNMLRFHNAATVKNIFFKQAAKFGVRINSFVNVGNHVHLVVRFSKRIFFQNFLRTAAALVARAITKARKGNAFGKFWDDLAFTRVSVGSFARAVLSNYVFANQIEAENGTAAREDFLKKRPFWLHGKSLRGGMLVRA